ncbi:SUKH-4 family immunity protein [Novipirellula caenicola]|uniref:SUKH-4 immunity protein n=1 Tax=Novipirellula caenicola TaxID=1536901 RepID=A0ABP9W1M0_9BACT
MLDKTNITELVRSQLPDSYDPLNLTFGYEQASPVDSAVAIGSDYGTTICVDLQSEHVIAIDRAGVYRTRFMNSSIPQLAQCIAAHRDYCDWMIRTRAESEELSVVSDFRDRLLDTDRAALDNTENWWSVIVEQAETGQL